MCIRDRCILRVHCLGGWNETHTYVIPIYDIWCVTLFPAKAMVPPVLCISTSSASPYVWLWWFVVSASAFTWVFCVVLAPPAGHRNAGLVCFFAPFLAFRLVLSCSPDVGPLPGHIIGLIVPANSNLGTRPAPCAPARWIWFRLFPSFLWSYFHFLSVISVLAPFLPFLPFFV